MNQARLYSIILGPHISEKATIMAETRNQVAFKVINDATKTEVKEAVEKLFKVSVTGLQILNVKGKTKRTARGSIRKKSNWKKAYVQLAQGQEIDFAELN
jgi:large subunit ribosomal protein L23